MTQPVNNSSSPTAINTTDLGPTSSLQFLFAKLQLELAATAKTSAKDRLELIKNSQEEQKLVSQLLNEARQAQANAKKGVAGDTESVTYSNGTTEKNTKNCTLMSKEMVDYMDKNKLAYDKTGQDHNNNEEEWKTAITSLEGRLDTVGMDTQQQMVYVQDFMGQYNSYLQGANTQIGNANQTLTSLARGQ